MMTVVGLAITGRGLTTENLLNDGVDPARVLRLWKWPRRGVSSSA